MIVLETPRTILRHLSTDDVNALAPLYADPETMKYFPRVRTHDETLANIKYLINLQETYGYSLWALVLKSNGQMIGRCGLLPWELDGKTEVELAYMVSRSFWGQGLATEVSLAVTAMAFSEMKIDRLIALIRPGNDMSQRVATKVGMDFERMIDLDEAQCQLFSIERGSFTMPPTSCL